MSTVAVDREDIDNKMIVAHMLDGDHLLSPMTEGRAWQMLDAFAAAVRHEHGERIAKAIEADRDNPAEVAIHPAAHAAFTYCADQARDLSPHP